ncbi:MAG: hypothetical protein WD767_02995 [Alphaproteobacteria bacterium]
MSDKRETAAADAVAGIGGGATSMVSGVQAARTGAALVAAPDCGILALPDLSS